MAELEIVPTPVERAGGRDLRSGQFVKGNTIRKPGSLGGGRPRKLDAIEVLESIVNTFTPEQVSNMLVLARNIAIKNDDWKGILEVARFVAAYAIGKPVQRSITAGIDQDTFVKLFMEGGGEDGDDNGVDTGVG